MGETKCFALHRSILRVRHERSGESDLPPRVGASTDIELVLKDQAVTVEYAAENGTAAASYQIGGYMNLKNNSVCVTVSNAVANV